jgi:hypothetical protein
MSTKNQNTKKKSSSSVKVAAKKKSVAHVPDAAHGKAPSEKKKPGPKKGSTRKKAAGESPIAKKAVAKKTVSKKAAAPKPETKKAVVKKQVVAKKPIPNKALSDRQFGDRKQFGQNPNIGLSEFAKKYSEYEKNQYPDIAQKIFQEKPTTAPNAPSSPIFISPADSVVANVAKKHQPKANKRSIWRRLTGWMRPSRKRK